MSSARKYASNTRGRPFQPGNPGKPKALGKLHPLQPLIPRRGQGVVTDASGLVFVADPAHEGVYALNSEGAHLELISVPDVALQCAIGGEDRKTIYISTPHGIYATRLEIPGLRMAKN